MNTRSQTGLSIISAILAVAILAIGTGTVISLVRSNSVSQSNLSAQAQRATYTTFQQEVVVQGIDPSKIVNPLGAIAQPVTAVSTPEKSVSGIAVSTNVSSDLGSSKSQSLAMQGASATDTRAGGLGIEDLAGGTANPITVTPLNAPSFSPGLLPLSVSSFPATGWVVMPANPPGTVYRYTVDGSDPTTSSPIWNVSAATAMTAANFPRTMKLAAFNTDPSYSESAVAALTPITMNLPVAVMARNAGGSSPVFNYWDMTSLPANGMLLTPATMIAGVPMTIRYTYDGSDPASSPTAQTFSGDFIVPFSNWNTAATPATASLRTLVVGPDARYNPAAGSISLSNAVVQMPPPTFSIAASAGPINHATAVVFGDTVPSAVFRFASWSTPTSSSPSSSSASAP